MREYKIHEGSVHQRFLESRKPIQIFGGGFGNGKTAATCIKVLQIVQDYPGCNGLIARSTFPKLNDTIRKEFKRWCPASILSAFPTSKNSDNTAKFTNSSEVNFRYISQQGKMVEQSTSNQLSATYDFIAVDQMEDPEITYKDFLDLIGRLRGNTIYRGSDSTMPKIGPQFFIMTCNPSSGWIYKQIVRPLKQYEQSGHISDDLLCERDDNGRPILHEGKPVILVDLFEAPTYANADNLSKQYIKLMESTYKGQMRERYMMGKWASYEGLIYPMWSDMTNVIAHRDMENYLDDLVQFKRYRPTFVEAYDFGIASPSCYLLAFIDPEYKVHVIDGFYQKEFDIKEQAKTINALRASYGAGNELIYADPSIFRRNRSASATIGKSTPDLFWDHGKIRMRRGNNDITNGILKVSSYLYNQSHVRNPYSGDTHSPMLFVSDKLGFISDEMATYMWKKDPYGTPLDEPVDRDDHAMDTIKYLLSDVPEVGDILAEDSGTPSYMRWQVNTNTDIARDFRHG